MSNRERAILLLEKVPEYKMDYVVVYLMGLTAGEEEPDEWDLKMIDEAKRENDGEAMSFEEMAKELGVVL
ncbi:MAG: hypothetical protein LUE29_04030 [Lachnospiraceae bacterium]|nr:hypothetical protein [Lachnospiraceae bacterium]